MADQDAERIKYETEVLKATLLVAVATGGGSLSLVFGDFTLLRLVLAIGGICLTFVLFVGVWRQDRRIRTLIDQIPRRDHA